MDPFFWNIKVESDDDGHLESIDALGPGRRILIKKVHSGVDCQTLTKYSATFFASVTEHFGEILQ